MELQDWTVAYVKSRDAFHKTLDSYDVVGDEVSFVHDHKTHHFLVSPELSVPEPRDWYTVVCVNSEENVRFLAEHWEEFLMDGLYVLFVNLDEGSHWQVCPVVHDRIADPENLGDGLLSMASEAGFVS